MLFSIIIPTYNRINQLSECLKSIINVLNSTHTDSVEVIITDDNIKNQTIELINFNFPWAKLVKGPGKGPAANRNNGAKYAKGEWLIFIDDDCIADKNLVNAYLKAIKDNSGCMAYEGSIFPDSWDLLKKDLSECPINVKGECFWSANICIHKEFFYEVGGFDEDFLIAAQEDQQLKKNIEKHAASKIYFVQNSIVTHPVRFSSITEQIRKLPVKSKNYALFVFKNGYKSLIGFAFSQYKFHFKHFLLALIKGRYKSSIVSLIWLLVGINLNIYFLSRLKSNM